jgi:hypothetical protein
MPDPLQKDLPYSAASRLSGLRNLISSRGLHMPKKACEVAPESVRATPEFLPPRIVVEPVEDNAPGQARSAKQPRSKKPDQLDDVETLPSWRGQYRKRQ